MQDVAVSHEHDQLYVPSSCGHSTRHLDDESRGNCTSPDCSSKMVTVALVYTWACQ